MKERSTLLVLTRILISLIVSFLPTLAFAQGNSNPPPNAQDNNPPSRAARISFLKGNVSFQPAGQNQWSEASLNFTVTTGDRIYTDKDARAELEVGSATVRLSEETDLTITNLDDHIMQFGPAQGALRVSIYRFPSGDTVEIDTPNGSLTPRTSGSYRVNVDPSDNNTVVSANGGSLEITGDGISQTLNAGQAAKLTGQGSVLIALLPFPRSDDFDKWCDDRDRRLQSPTSAKYVNPDIPGYEDLDSYGSWEMVADYGPVWYPSAVPGGWIPYRFGHWAWIGPWGWTWVEDEPWGFCAFHYGRWVHIGVRWGWLPGPIAVAPVYAPGFVAFVGGASFSIGVGAGVSAWFPLGPGEPFFPWYHYGGDYLRIVNITNLRNVTNIDRIINVTDIRNVHYAYRTIAVTAVRADVFRNGLPVAGHMIGLTREQLMHAEVIPHPGINPTARAILPGRPVAMPPVRPVAFAAHGPVRPGLASAAARLAPAGRFAVPPRAAPPRFITRAEPPPARVPFAVQQRAMFDHPGRPLEPQQIENLRMGRPVGPMLDKEFPAHLQPVVPEHVVPHSLAAKSRRP